MLPPGKIEHPSFWSLRVKVMPICVKGEEIMAADFAHANLASADCINVEVFYDQKTLAVMRLDTVQELVFEMIDDQANHDHELAFEMSGKTDEHTNGIGPDQITMCAQVEIWIESWRAIQFITEDAPLIMGENAIRKHMYLQTPIYRWLLNNTDKIFGHYSLEISHDSPKKES